MRQSSVLHVVEMAEPLNILPFAVMASPGEGQILKTTNLRVGIGVQTIQQGR